MRRVPVDVDATGLGRATWALTAAKPQPAAVEMVRSLVQQAHCYRAATAP